MTPQIEKLLNLSTPAVMIHCPNGTIPRHGTLYALLKNDDRAVGKTAAEHFLSKSKFRTYAFIPTPSPTNWSDERLAGFAERLAQKGAAPVVWRQERGPPRTSSRPCQSQPRSLARRISRQSTF